MKLKTLCSIAILIACCACTNQYNSYQTNSYRSSAVQTKVESKPICVGSGQDAITDGYTITSKEIPKPPCAGVTIEYKTHTTSYNDASKDADTQFMQGEERNKYLATVPEGGFIIVKMDSISIDVANTQYWKVVVTDDSNNVLSSYEGNFSIPISEYLYSTTLWRNVLIAPVNCKIADKFNVYVISTILNKRWGYTISKNAN